MTDILGRLWASDESSALTNEAAREIEKLRTALTEITYHSVCCDARHTADKALKQPSDSGHSIHKDEQP